MGMGSEILRGGRQEHVPSEGAIECDGGQAVGDRKGVGHRATQLPGADQEAPQG